MSRIGKLPIPVPKGVDVSVQDSTVTVKGPKGTLSRPIPGNIMIKVEPEVIRVERPGDGKLDRSLHGLTRTLVANMVTGVTQGFEKILEVHGVGYRATVAGNKLTVQVGYSHPVEVDPKPGISFEVGQDTDSRAPLIMVRGIDKEVVGQQAAEIRSIRKPGHYWNLTKSKGKGIRYRGEFVLRKPGKSAKAGGKK